MNNETENTENTAVMDWREAARIKAAEQQARANALSQSNKFISFKSGILAVDKVPAPGNKLEVIALTFCSENTWYKTKFDANNVQTPACWSVYTTLEDMVPNDKSADKQAANCEVCPKFKWGSDPQGGRGKACKSRYRLALLPGSINTVDEAIAAPLRFAVLPVTSGADYDKFMADCSMSFGRPTFGVVAELKVTPDAKSQYKVSLTPLRAVPDDLMLAILDRVNLAEKAIMYEYGLAEETGSEAPSAKL